jgi:chemotaxis family two-component system response regulator Rcp1
MINEPKSVEILLVEDNEGDAFLTKKAFAQAKVLNNLTIAIDGEVALEILRQEGEYQNAPRPDIVLLDINLPKKNGKEVLKEIKDDDNLKRIPVIVLTSSKADQDIIKSYDLHASSYVVKPIDLAKFQEAVTAIENFWLSVVVLPEE